LRRLRIGDEKDIKKKKKKKPQDENIMTRAAIIKSTVVCNVL